MEHWIAEIGGRVPSHHGLFQHPQVVNTHPVNNPRKFLSSRHTSVLTFPDSFEQSRSTIQSSPQMALQQDGRYAIVDGRLSQALIFRHSMKAITVLLLDQMFSSTAIGPMEVFRHAGSLWNILTGMRL